MVRDTIISWRTFALSLLFPPLAILAVVLFPLTIAVLLWLYYRGKTQIRTERAAGVSGGAADGRESER
ncbi:hypothetical protein [Haloarcula marina]|uniref:hypothetical protein n=1 Tax=Haloarcula marina TaxID=2961574 RepID=UPI0020B75476|nr:hypothetical protein [Halomicroarcula marina]